jgi:glycosyltransferase involved in cell wall biosynthesis
MPGNNDYLFTSTFEAVPKISMKIAIISITTGHYSRGMESLIDELVTKLSCKHTVTVYSPTNIPFTIKWQKYTFGKMTRLFMMDYHHGVTFQFTKRVLEKLNKNPPDIVIPTNGGWQALMVRLWTWMHRKKMVILGQAGLGWCDGWNLLMQPDLFVASSQRNKIWASKTYGKNIYSEVISNGVDTTKFTLQGHKAVIALPKPIVLCVAGWDRYKRVEETINAVSLTKCSLLVIGGNNSTKMLGKKLLKNRYKQMSLPYESMPEMYRAADLFTMCSDSTEAFGTSYLEALAVGLPIVATDDDLRHEILQKYALFVDPTNPRSYAAAIGKALKTKRKRDKQFIRQFDWQTIALEYEKVFTSLLT